jgi:hypothetical protein
MTPTTRVQVYFEDSRVAQAPAEESAAAGASLSRTAERIITRGLSRRLAGDPEDRLLAVERAIRDHGRAMARDMTFVQELMAQFARELFTVLPERPGDRDPLYQAAVEARVQRFIDATVAQIIGAGVRTSTGETSAPVTADEPRTFQAAE